MDIQLKKSRWSFIGLLLLAVTVAHAKPYSVTSPNGRLQATIEAGSGMSLSVALDGEVLLRPSALGLTLDDGTQVAVSPVARRQQRKHVSEDITAPFYRQKTIHVEYNQLDLRLKNGFGIMVRAYDSGIAYAFYNRNEAGCVIRDEQADFSFGGHRKAWLSYTTSDKTPYAMAFQNIYDVTPLDSARQQVAFLPATVDCGKAKVTLLESDVEHYPCMWVKAGGGCLKAEFAPYPARMDYYPWRHMTHVTATEPYIARTDGNRRLPWRILTVTESDTDMPVNDLVYALATPNRIGDTSWVKPGKVAWDWWCDWNLKGIPFKAGINFDTYKYYIDFAASHGLEYIILDEGWYDSRSGDIMHPLEAVRLPELVSYAGQKGVGIVLWAVFNVMDENLEQICSHYAQMGIKGFKVDFMDRNDQTAVEMVERLADCAARHHLFLDLHGIYTPVGLNRTYPNVLNYESVFGMEEVKWGNLKNDHPRYDVTFPFIRGMAGQTDFTPGAMSNGTRTNWAARYDMPMSMGTRCHQAATYIVYDSPFTMLADAPTAYEADEPFTQYVASLPVVFDRTAVLDGSIGEYIVTMRQKDGAYYVGGMTNWDERDIHLDCSFLPPGRAFTATILRDGINAGHNAEDYAIVTRPVDSTSGLDIHLASGGGFVVKMEAKE